MPCGEVVDAHADHRPPSTCTLIDVCEFRLAAGDLGGPFMYHVVFRLYPAVDLAEVLDRGGLGRGARGRLHHDARLEDTPEVDDAQHDYHEQRQEQGELDKGLPA